MPEVITKHPDVVKEVLQSAGAKCGVGAPQKILTKCPREQFCSLPGGEICVYPVSRIPDMTQLTRAELCQPRTEALPPAGKGTEWGLGAVLPAFIAGALMVGRRWRRSRHRNGG
jgi:hypothetical protein